MTQKIVSIGSCNVCQSEVHKVMIYLEAPDTARGITLEAGDKITGFWVWCINTDCEHNGGEGTLPAKPKGLPNG